MANPYISIVMVNYNGLKYLERTISPLLELDYSYYELIVVDNGSTDGSIEFLRSFNKIQFIRSPRIREKNFACNYAVNLAKGNFILLLDNDALITHKRILSDLLEQYHYNKKTGLIGLSFYNEKTTVSKSYIPQLGYYFIKHIKPIPISDLVKYNNSEIGFPEGKGLFIKKSIWQKVGGYDDFLLFGGDDSDLGIKLWLMGYRNYLYSKTIQIHIGLDERQDNKKYALKWKEVFYAHLYTIVKNYTFLNMIITLIGFSLFGFFKTLKQALARRHLRTFLSFFEGYYLFFINLPINLKKRRMIQIKRIIKHDIFLRIKPIISTK